MTDQSRTTCRTCVTPIAWIDCPTGGWWAHDEHPADEHDAVPAAWVDGDPLMEAVASEVWEYCLTEGTSLVVDDPRNIAAVAVAVARAHAPAAQTPATTLPAVAHTARVAEAIGDRLQHTHPERAQGAYEVMAALRCLARGGEAAEPPTDRAALREQIARAARDVQLRIEPMTRLLVEQGEPIILSRDEADAVADAVLAVLPVEDHRLALSEALGLGTGAPWEAIHERVKELRRMATAPGPEQPTT